MDTVGFWIGFLMVVASLAHMFFTRQQRGDAQQNLRQPAERDATQSHQSLPAAEMPTSIPPNENRIFLQLVRERSCYPVLRSVHGFITYTAIGVIVIAWIALLIISDSTGDRVYATLACGLVVVVAVIEYGFFRVVVDAVDVLIDTSRPKAGDKISE